MFKFGKIYETADVDTLNVIVIQFSKKKNDFKNESY